MMNAVSSVSVTDTQGGLNCITRYFRWCKAKAVNEIRLMRDAVRGMS